MLREPELLELTRQVNGLSRTTDNVLSTIAARQHGRVATWQLAACSISDDEIRSRVASHRLHRVELGVYAVGHPGAGPEAARMAAVLGQGPRGLLSHWALAHHLALFDGPGARRIDVTVPGARRADRAGTRLHLPRRMTRGEVSENPSPTGSGISRQTSSGSTSSASRGGC